MTARTGERAPGTGPGAVPLGLRPAAVGLRPRTTAALVLASLAGRAMFVWPLLLVPEPGSPAHLGDAPLLFVLLLPLLVAVVLAELADGGLDSRALALLGVLAAVGAALRPLGAGTAGVELVFPLLVLGGRVFGPGFGFALGALTMLASALLTGGVGPWLPYQMLGAAWVGLFAGLLPAPRLRGRGELLLLAAYGAVAALVFGMLLNLWFWPYALPDGTGLSVVPGDAVVDNLRRFVLFTLATSTLGWDLGRAVTTVAVVLLLGGPVLAALRRAARRARLVDDRPVT